MEQPTVVKYSRGLKRVSLERFLISKIVYEPEKITFSDMIALFDNLIWLELKSQSDPDFRIKFGNSLEELTIILKEINFSSGFSAKALIKMSKRVRSRLEGFYLPRRNYPDFKKRFGGLFTILALKKPKDSNKHIPPKRVIGVGYRDKGTAQSPAFDGSPSWQEVASRSGQLALAKKRIREAKTFEQISRSFKEYFGIE